jgi:hypothetical protein
MGLNLNKKIHKNVDEMNQNLKKIQEIYDLCLLKKVMRIKMQHPHHYFL